MTIIRPAVLAAFLCTSCKGEECDTSHEATIADLQGQIDTLEGDLATAESDLETAQADLAAAQAELEEANATIAALDELLGPPPDFLDDLYPPTTEAPVLLMEMFGMVAPFEGLILDMATEDTDNIAADFTAFQTQYEHIRTNVVPEWADLMPTEPVDALGTALEGGDQAAIGAALGEVGAVCGSCHDQYMTRVQFKYHWPDFDSVVLTDPISSADIEWHEAMQSMALFFNGTTHDLAQGQVDAARGNFALFTAYFDEVADGCYTCHDTERTYFVDATIQAQLDLIDTELAKDSPDIATVGGLIGGVGQEACFKCHLVHQPSAHTKHVWEAMEGSE